MKRAGRTFSTSLVAAVLLCLSALATKAQVETPAGADTEQWALAPGVIVPLTERVEVFALGAYIRGKQTTTFASVDVRFKVNKFLTITPGYFGLFVPKVRGRRDYDNRARLAATLNFSLRDLKISDRNLVERRFRTSRDSTRYRNQLRLEHPVALGRAKFNVYAYTEPVYDFSEKQWTRNFAALGVNKTFAGRYTADVFYFGQFARGSRTVDALIFGLTVRLPQLFGDKKPVNDE